MVSGWHRVFIINRTLIKLISYIIPCSNVFSLGPLVPNPISWSCTIKKLPLRHAACSMVVPFRSRASDMQWVARGDCLGNFYEDV